MRFAKNANVHILVSKVNKDATGLSPKYFFIGFSIERSGSSLLPMAALIARYTVKIATSSNNRITAKTK
ncbi:hypothetical protein GCM10027181_29260 [Rheinheimera gaetbuli]